jgi:hypothetical protein
MKKLCLATVFAAAILFCMNGILAQTSQSKLDQIELFKQFTGSWKSEMGKDTVEYTETKSYGTGLEASFKQVTKDKIFFEGKQLYGYDKKTDKFILSVLGKGKDMVICEMWFTSKNICICIPYSDLSTLQKASYKVEMEIKSPDVMIYKTIVNNKVVETFTFNRIKN